MSIFSSLQAGIGGAEYDIGPIVPFAAFFISWFLLRFFAKYAIAKIQGIAKKTKTDLDDLLVDLISQIPITVYFLVSLYIGIQFIEIGNFIKGAIWGGILFVAVYYLIHAVHIIIDYGTKSVIKRRRKADKGEDVSFIILMSKLVKYSLWIVGFLLILSNLDFDISALIAGMGVGGLAIALAAQNILEDIFASFSIFFDKPYKVGDFIYVGSDKGEVLKIGIKSTRIKTLRGEELVVSNREMTSTRVHNFGKMPHRRIDFSVGITYDTPVSKVKAVPKMIENIIKKMELVRFDRAHLKW